MTHSSRGTWFGPLGYFLSCLGLLGGGGFLVYLGFQQHYGEIIYAKAGAFDSAPILLVPMPRTPQDFDEPAAYLIGKDRRVIHQWTFEVPAISAAILEGGRLLAMHFAVHPKTDVAGECDEIAEYDRTGKKLRSLRGYYFTHDIEPLPNGNFATITLEKIDRATQSRWSMRQNPVGDSYADRFIEVNSQNEVVWDWRVTDHLADLEFNGKEVQDYEISHANSIRYLPKDPIHARPAYLISFRNLSRVIIVDRATKKIVWRSPQGVFRFQHDASLLENGNILVFNNGIAWNQVKTVVMEIDPRTNQTGWVYSGRDAWHFEIPFMGAAQRLSNGNTLIVDGPLGHIFEVDRDSNVVWNYLVPIRSKMPAIQNRSYWHGHPLFRVRTYPGLEKGF